MTQAVRAKCDDHIPMIHTATGVRKAMPFWLVQQWVDGQVFSLDIGIRNKIGYEFENFEKGVAAFREWQREEAEILAERRRRAEPPPYPDLSGCGRVAGGETEECDAGEREAPRVTGPSR